MDQQASLADPFFLLQMQGIGTNFIVLAMLYSSIAAVL
jgi:hypothetical protein